MIFHVLNPRVAADQRLTQGPHCLLYYLVVDVTTDKMDVLQEISLSMMMDVMISTAALFPMIYLLLLAKPVASDTVSVCSTTALNRGQSLDSLMSNSRTIAALARRRGIDRARAAVRLVRLVGGII